jgi:hypothetical protein
LENGISKSKRRKLAEQRFRERMDRLRPHMAISASGRRLVPGTREYERSLADVASHLSDEAVEDIVMPKGPKGELRPADVIGAAVMVGTIATGKIQEPKTALKSAAAELGSKGGKARAKILARAQRKKIASTAAKKRWGQGE